jgi:hypothetical protein
MATVALRLNRSHHPDQLSTFRHHHHALVFRDATDGNETHTKASPMSTYDQPGWRRYDDDRPAHYYPGIRASDLPSCRVSIRYGESEPVAGVHRMTVRLCKRCEGIRSRAARTAVRHDQ